MTDVSTRVSTTEVTQKGDFHINLLKIKNQSLRKITKTGNSLAVTLPVHIIAKLRWREHQKVVVRLRGKKVAIQDWQR